MFKSRDRWQTVAKAFDDICDNQTPWVAIGNFLNYWWAYAVDYRRELVETPIAPASTPETQRWAAFCAAMVEWLCWQADVPFPAWTDQECYILPEPWFLYEKWSRRTWLLATTPAPFQMRNIFGGDRMFLHKWDMARQMQEGKYTRPKYEFSDSPQAS